MQRPCWAPAEVDVEIPSIARVYDYWIGGTHNFPVDRALAQQVATANPALPKAFRANRAFLQRAVRDLAGRGVRQFLDIGAGIPTQGNVHEIAFEVNPDCRVVYVDIDPVAVAHGRAILADEPRAVSIHGDLYKPRDILEAPETRRLLDVDQPIALILAAILHFVPGEDDPVALVGQYTNSLVPGSFLVISHAGAERVPESAPVVARSYQSAVSEVIWRDPGQVAVLFGDLDLIEPGVVQVHRWRPDIDHDPEGLGMSAQMFAGVARKRAR